MMIINNCKNPLNLMIVNKLGMHTQKVVTSLHQPSSHRKWRRPRVRLYAVNGMKARCPECGEFNPIAKQKCRTCYHVFPRKTIDWEKIKSKGKTSTTHTREMLEYRANILHAHHGWDVLVFYYNKNQRGSSLHKYGTPGVALKFVGKNKKAETKSSKAVSRLVKKFFKDKKNRDVPPVCDEDDEMLDSDHANDVIPSSNNVSSLLANGTLIASDNMHVDDNEPTTSSNIHTADNTDVGTSHDAAATSNVHTSDATPITSDNLHADGNRNVHATTTRNVHIADSSNVNTTANTGLGTNRSKTANNNVHTSASVSSLLANTTPVTSGNMQADSNRSVHGITSSNITPGRSNVNIVSITNFGTSNGTAANNNIHSSASGNAHVVVNAQPNVVIYSKGGKSIAVGYLDDKRRTLHGKLVPADHVCVQITWTVPDAPAPLPLGDEDENATIQKGMFYALPKADLRKVQLQNGGQNTLHLSQF